MPNYVLGYEAIDIIQDAADHLAFNDPGQPLSGLDAETLMRSLEMMIKAWSAQGIGLWLNQEICIFLPNAAQSVFLGPSGSNASALEQVVSSTVLNSALSGAGTLDLVSTTGFLDTQFVGIELDDGTMQWATINGAPVGSTVTLTAVLTGDVSVGNAVFSYSALIQRPLEMLNMKRRDFISQIDVPMWMISRDEYMMQPLKSSVGVPNSVYYHPSLTNGTLYVWPTTDSVRNVLIGTAKMPIQNFDDLANAGYFPEEWYEALVYNLAVRGLTKYSCPQDKAQLIMGMASDTLEKARWFDNEDTSVIIGVGRY